MLRYTVLAVADFVTLFWGVGESRFLSKKVANGIKELKTVKSGDPELKKQTVATEKHVAATIVRIPLKANGSVLAPTRHCCARKCCPRSLLPILIKNRLSSRTARLRMPPFPYRKHCWALANCGFAIIFAAPKLARLR